MDAIARSAASISGWAFEDDRPRNRKASTLAMKVLSNGIAAELLPLLKGAIAESRVVLMPNRWRPSIRGSSSVR